MAGIAKRREVMSQISMTPVVKDVGLSGPKVLPRKKAN